MFHLHRLRIRSPLAQEEELQEGAGELAGETDARPDPAAASFLAPSIGFSSSSLPIR